MRGLDQYHFTNKEKRYLDFVRQFNMCNITMKESYFHKKCQALRMFLRKYKWAGEIKKSYMDFFSEENWKKLDSNQQINHSLHQCDQCKHNYSEVQNTFPSVVKHRKKKIQPMKNITNIVSTNKLMDTSDNIISHDITSSPEVESNNNNILSLNTTVSTPNSKIVSLHIPILKKKQMPYMKKLLNP